MTARLTFCGGVGEVTGANFLLEGAGTRILIDCGAHQREDMSHSANYAPFPYDVTTVDTLIITHAHQDHIGRIPRLVHDGFSGVICSTPATKELAALMFDDALRIMHNDRHEEPLYEPADVERTLALWRVHEYHTPFAVGDASCEFLDAGHILGSAMARLTHDNRTILFTGDLGNTPEPLLRPTESPTDAHYIVMESVYGDRVHEERGDRREHLRAAIEETRSRGGILLIPSFSLERTQVLLSEMNELVESGAMMPIPVYVDAPLALRATDVYRAHRNDLNDETRERWEKGDDPFAFEGLHLTPRRADSEAIHQSSDPKVIIAGAGMSHGGRIREHEREYLGRPTTTVLFVGYQAPGSLGRRLQEGARVIELDGVTVRVRARMDTLSGYSGHADRDQLVDFAAAADTAERIFVVMGEPKASQFLAQRIRDFIGIDTLVPVQGQTVEIQW
jgi:metallo-beta-lactamase family protein